tara:strand:+ start:80 stop:358 length:279 start_codon:yes stop_codon:yes gene_type:complete
MKKIYSKHVFVCENVRGLSNKKSCGEIGSEIRIQLKKKVLDRGLNKKIRINKSGCLGKCNKGPCLVVYPKGNWVFNAKEEDCEEIFNQLILE